MTHSDGLVNIALARHLARSQDISQDLNSRRTVPGRTLRPMVTGGGNDAPSLRNGKGPGGRL